MTLKLTDDDELDYAEAMLLNECPSCGSNKWSYRSWGPKPGQVRQHNKKCVREIRVLNKNEIKSMVFRKSRNIVKMQIARTNSFGFPDSGIIEVEEIKCCPQDYQYFYRIYRKLKKDKFVDNHILEWNDE